MHFVVAALLASVAGVARAADTFFLDWIVGPGGIVVADADDRFFVRRDSLNASAQFAAWRTEAAELVFEIGPDHVLQTPGADDGPSQIGYLDNFAWGTLRLKSGQHLELQDGNATPGGAQYVRRLLLEGGVAQIKYVSSDGTWLYYDPGEPENDYLAGGTYPLVGGGAIAPVVSAPACDNGLDDDGDGLVDFPADPGCHFATSDFENPACDDGLDNDGDGKIDWDGGPAMVTPDPECTVAYRNRETPSRWGGCGLGAELVLVIPLLGLAASRRRRANQSNPAPA